MNILDELNGLSNLENNAQNLLDKQKICIKHIKIKRSTRTCLHNIDQWLTESEINDLKKKAQKKLATSSQVIKDEKGLVLTFNGDHTMVIKNIALNCCSNLKSECFD